MVKSNLDKNIHKNDQLVIIFRFMQPFFQK